MTGTEESAKVAGRGAGVKAASAANRAKLGGVTEPAELSDPFEFD